VHDLTNTQKTIEARISSLYSLNFIIFFILYILYTHTHTLIIKQNLIIKKIIFFKLKILNEKVYIINTILGLENFLLSQYNPKTMLYLSNQTLISAFI